MLGRGSLVTWRYRFVGINLETNARHWIFGGNNLDACIFGGYLGTEARLRICWKVPWKLELGTGMLEVEFDPPKFGFSFPRFSHNFKSPS